MKRLLSYIAELKGKSIIAPLFKCLESLFELFVPMVIAYMIDAGIQRENTAIIWKSLGMLYFIRPWNFPIASLIRSEVHLY